SVAELSDHSAVDGRPAVQCVGRLRLALAGGIGQCGGLVHILAGWRTVPVAARQNGPGRRRHQARRCAGRLAGVAAGTVVAVADRYTQPGKLGADGRMRSNVPDATIGPQPGTGWLAGPADVCLTYQGLSWFRSACRQSDNRSSRLRTSLGSRSASAPCRAAVAC